LWSHDLTSGLIADVVTFLGLLLTLWARVVLGGNWSSGVAFKEQHELIERGPYAYVRHPIYSGVLVMFLGIAIFRGIISGFILLAIVFVGLWLKAVQEEKLLTRHFGETYLQYKGRVKALVPFVW
jgi:protein-S-isoprenylcysteine O-methyltransferase Ste14